MSFPQDGTQQLLAYHDFRLGGVQVRDQYLSLIDDREFYIGCSIDPSGYLGIFNSLDKLPYDQFTVTTNPFPDDHEVYINYPIGYLRFSEFETWVNAFLDYASLGSVPMASGFNLTNRTLEEVQDHLLDDRGIPRLDVLETDQVNASGAFANHVSTHIDAAHPGVLSRTKQNAATLYNDSVQDLDLGFADPNGQRTLRNHFIKHPIPYWQQLAADANDPTTIKGYVDAQHAFAVSASGTLQGELNALSARHDSDLAAEHGFAASASSVLQQQVTSLGARHDSDFAAERAYLVETSGTLQEQIAATRDYTQGYVSEQLVIASQDLATVSGQLTRQIADHAAQNELDFAAARDFAINASGVLQNQIVAEITARSTIVAGLQNQVDADRAWAWAASGNFQGQVTALQAKVTDNSAWAVTASGNLQSQLAAEATARLNTDAGLQTQITSNHAWAVAASGNFQGQVASEAATRSSAVTALQNQMNANQSWAQSASGNLQSQITTLQGASHAQNTDAGTSSATFQVGGGVKLKNGASGLEVRNSTDTGYADLDVNNLRVRGTTTTINSETVNIADALITLNSNVSGVPTENGGVEIQRGASANAQILWDESTDQWIAGISGSLAAIFTHAGALDHNDISDWNNAVNFQPTVSGLTLAQHIHANKAVLDGTEQSFTSALKIKVDGIEAGAQVNTVTGVSGGTPLNHSAATRTIGFQQGLIDHGSIGGLSDDDHPSYLNDTRHDLTARHPLGGVVPHDALAGLSDAQVTAPASGQVLVYDQSAWENKTLAQAGVAAAQHTHPGTEITTAVANATAATTATRLASARSINRVPFDGTANIDLSSVRIADTRAAGTAPSGYASYYAAFEFKQRSAIGNPGVSGSFAGVMTLVPWSDNSGGSAYQLAFTPDGMSLRYAPLGQSTWGAWTTVLTAEKWDDTAHGARGGGALHADVTSSADGFMTAVQNNQLATLWASGVLDSDFGGTGLVRRTGTNTYDTIADNSATWTMTGTLIAASGANWSRAYDNMLHWDGTAVSLNPSGARGSLGLGAMATQNSNAVAITGGTLTGLTALRMNYYAGRQFAAGNGWLDVSSESSGYGLIATNAYMMYSGSTRYRYANTHGSIGAHGIYFDSFNIKLVVSPSGSSTADADFTPTIYATFNKTTCNFAVTNLQQNGSQVWHAGNLRIGTEVQGYSANLTSLAALSPAANAVPLGNGTSWGSLNVSSAAGNSTIVQRDSSGYIWGNFLNLNHPNTNTDPITAVYIERGSDGYVRKQTLAQFRKGMLAGMTGNGVLYRDGSSTDLTTDANMTWDSTNRRLSVGALLCTGSASCAPLVITSGTPGTAATGAVEYDGTHLYGVVGSPTITRFQLDGQRLVVRTIEGAITTGTLMYHVVTMSNNNGSTCGRVQSVRVCLGALSTGQSVKVDVRKNGTASVNSIFMGDTPAEILTTATTTSGIYQTTGTLDSTQTQLAQGDVLYVVVTQVGSTYAGADLWVGMEIG